MKFIATVDTEADDQWSGTKEVTLRNLDGLARFQSFMEARGVPPTYLASHETLTHPALAELAQVHREGRAEVGGHLHPWTTPPYDAGDAVQRFPLELSDEALEAKLDSLTGALRTLLGEQPRSFRAGRWGADERVLTAIAKAGYTVDSSVTPGIDWGRIVRDSRQHARIPDFRAAKEKPYHVPGTALLEIPMSILPTGPLPALSGGAQSKGFRGMVARVLARPRWCRIFPETQLADLVRVHRTAVRLRLPALVFMTHSSELTAGTSPYAKNTAAVERTYELLSDFLAYLAAQQVVPLRMGDAATALAIP